MFQSFSFFVSNFIQTNKYICIYVIMSNEINKYSKKLKKIQIMIISYFIFCTLLTSFKQKKKIMCKTKINNV